jgi:hypothetical protein
MKDRRGFGTTEAEHGLRANRANLIRDRASSDIAAIKEGGKGRVHTRLQAGNGGFPNHIARGSKDPY